MTNTLMAGVDNIHEHFLMRFSSLVFCHIEWQKLSFNNFDLNPFPSCHHVSLYCQGIGMLLLLLNPRPSTYLIK